MPLSPGQALNKRYRIVKLLGEGGFGAVYRAWDMTLQRPCAVKENLETTPKSQRQFEKEAVILANLDHPNLPRVNDHFVIQGQGQYLVMDFVEGEDLAQKMAKAGGALPETEALAWIEQVCIALTYMHCQNPPVIHRDIKPANVKITPDGRVKLVDFGIAKLYDPNLRTTAGARAVTPGYSPPEQYGSGATDARSDVYALGATCFTMLTGVEPPDSVDVMSGVAQAPEPVQKLNPQVSPGMGVVLAKAMQTNRAARFDSVAEFRSALKVASIPGKGAGSNAKPVPPTVQTPPPQNTQAWTPSSTAGSGSLSALPWGWIGALGGFGLLVVVCIAVVIGILIDGNGKETPTPTEAAVVHLADTIPIPTLKTATVPATDRQTNTPEATTPAVLTTGLTLVSEVDDMLMVSIPAGAFMMGSEGGNSDEQPVHSIYLDAYWIDQTEITNAMFAMFLNTKGNQEEGGVNWLDEGDADARIHQSSGQWLTVSGYADHPVVEVSWYGARAYCQWVGRRLPTEAEWEKAARGGLEGALYPWGDQDPVCQKGAENGAKFDVNAGCNDTGTESVRSYSPNGYGLYDMAGNVWEWVSSLHQDYPYSATEGREDLSASGGRVLRGGSWYNLANNLRVATRVNSDPDNSNDIVGFRCALSP